MEREESVGTPDQYLAARRAQYCRQDAEAHQAEHALEDCLRALADVWREWRRLRPEPPGTVRLALLVRRDLCEDLAERVANPPASPDRQFTVLGPWPPYSFV